MSVELNRLRDQIDVIDQQILYLLSKRFFLVKKIKAVKNRYGLSIYAPEREAMVLTSCCAEAKRLGIPIQLVRDILSRIMSESYMMK
ncbi:T-protein [Candidatus Photodesmus blepharus]|uniref:chorismate mutase n=1 Tax=Candidatus Photodesmus blepharonis TaxID=1179155 RepID=A0A084CMI1_9GAMM|nr:chorismate mutase [Candidatus Photodesmus blepharus]KEY91010.1 T-protein [Candidatus Photodesmus blepharus]